MGCGALWRSLYCWDLRGGLFRWGDAEVAQTTLIEEPETSVGRTDSSRRDFLKRAAVVAWSAPVIMTVTANRALANHPDGCIHSGATCTPSLTTPLAGCCALDPQGRSQVCCAATSLANPNKCARATGQACSNANQCCNTCTGGFCT